jgi:hypothetical protein
MLFWFVGAAVLSVWFVFGDPKFDYRFLIVGSVAPAIVDAPFGGARVLHSVVFSVALLSVLMAVTQGNRSRRKMLLGLPVGTLLHLVFTGAWENTTVFWWPFFGLGFDDAPHPIVSRSWWNVPLELVGLLLCGFIVRRARLLERDERRRFRATGQLSLPTR